MPRGADFSVFRPSRLQRLRTAVFAAAALFAASAGAAEGPAPIVPDGAAVVTGFSGAKQAHTATDAGSEPYFSLSLDGPTVRVLDLRSLGGPMQGQAFPAAKLYSATAGQVGQVFGVALDDAPAPNIFVAATSAYGLPIMLPGADANDQPKRLSAGAPGAVFMPGLFGPTEGRGGPGSVWRIDGTTGVVSRFVEVDAGGASNSGPALGGLAFDKTTHSLFVVDRETALIRRYAMDGHELGRYDHGVEGRSAAGLPPVGYDPSRRLDVTSPIFNTTDPMTWGYAPVERRIFGLAVHEGRLYYAVAEGLEIWSAVIEGTAGFGAGPRRELRLPAGAAPSEVSKIVFDGEGRMILAERTEATGSLDFRSLTAGGAARTLRYRRVQTDGQGPVWTADAEEYAVGFAAEERNVDGGVALGYGYGPDGAIDPKRCGGTVWTTGERLREADDTELSAKLAKMGPLNLHGLQGMSIGAIRPDDAPPFEAAFADYYDVAVESEWRGHIGDVEIPRRCGEATAVAAAPLAVIPWWPTSGGGLCPEGLVSRGGICSPPAPICPVGRHAGGVTCCPEGSAPGAGGACESIRTANVGCPIGATAVQRADGSRRCFWLAQCSAGGQPDRNGECRNFCGGAGGIAWPSRQCCPIGEIGTVDGSCCPRGQVHDGKCVRQICPPGTFPDLGGRCLPVCRDGEIRAADGTCRLLCPKGADFVSGRCVITCPVGQVVIGDGRCAPVCAAGERRGPDGQCRSICPGGLTLPNGLCVPIPPKCGLGERVGPDGFCHREVQNCPVGQAFIDGACRPNRPTCGPNEHVTPTGCEPALCIGGLPRLPNGQCPPPPPQCSPSERIGPDGRCHAINPNCPFGQTFTDGACRPNRPSCGPNERVTSTGCEPVLCVGGLPRLPNGLCPPPAPQCSPSERIGPDGLCHAVIPNCPFGQTFSDGACRLNKPSCGPNQRVTAFGCVPVPCTAGTLRMPNGQCGPVPPQCGPNERIGPDGHCHATVLNCPFGQTFSDGACRPNRPSCGPNQRVTAFGCEPLPCAAGLHRLPNGQCAPSQPQCGPGTRPGPDGRCRSEIQSCPFGQTFIAGGCRSNQPSCGPNQRATAFGCAPLPCPDGSPRGPNGQCAPPREQRNEFQPRVHEERPFGPSGFGPGGPRPPFGGGPGRQNGPGRPPGGGGRPPPGGGGQFLR